MTSTSNLVKFKPTYLYIKQHSVTGLMYFGKTIKDPIKYLGSGKYWRNHIKKHGTNYVVTLWHELFTNKDELISFALKFSKEMNISNSTSWANLIDENGTYGMTEGFKHTSETKVLMRSAKIGLSSNFKGKQHKRETRSQIGEKIRGSVSVFDIINLKCIRIPYAEYYAGKGTKYMSHSTATVKQLKCTINSIHAKY